VPCQDVSDTRGPHDNTRGRQPATLSSPLSRSDTIPVRKAWRSRSPSSQSIARHPTVAAAATIAATLALLLLDNSHHHHPSACHLPRLAPRSSSSASSRGMPRFMAHASAISSSGSCQSLGTRQEPTPARSSAALTNAPVPQSTLRAQRRSRRRVPRQISRPTAEARGGSARGTARLADTPPRAHVPRHPPWCTRTPC